MTDNRYQKLVKPGDQNKRPLRRGNAEVEIPFTRGNLLHQERRAGGSASQAEETGAHNSAVSTWSMSWST